MVVGNIAKYGAGKLQPRNAMLRNGVAAALYKYMRASTVGHLFK